MAQHRPRAGWPFAVLHTAAPDVLNEYYFGATGGGLWKTTDSGGSWFPVTDGKIGSSSIGAVAVAETNPDIIYIGGG